MAGNEHAGRTAGAETPHLLVVDDDERLRALLQRYLSANGFRVSAAAIGRRGPRADEDRWPSTF